MRVNYLYPLNQPPTLQSRVVKWLAAVPVWPSEKPCGGTFQWLTPEIDLPLDCPSSSMAAVTFPSGDSPCRGSQRTTLVRSPPATEGLPQLPTLLPLRYDADVLEEDGREGPGVTRVHGIFQFNDGLHRIKDIASHHGILHVAHDFTPFHIQTRR